MEGVILWFGCVDLLLVINVVLLVLFFYWNRFELLKGRKEVVFRVVNL